jgi:hypothetical protein
LQYVIGQDHHEQPSLSIRNPFTAARRAAELVRNFGILFAMHGTHHPCQRIAPVNVDPIPFHRHPALPVNALKAAF